MGAGLGNTAVKGQLPQLFLNLEFILRELPAVTSTREEVRVQALLPQIVASWVSLVRTLWAAPGRIGPAPQGSAGKWCWECVHKFARILGHIGGKAGPRAPRESRHNDVTLFACTIPAKVLASGFQVSCSGTNQAALYP